MIYVKESDRAMAIPDDERCLGASMDKSVGCVRFHLDRFTNDGDDKASASIRVLYRKDGTVYDGGLIT